MQTFKFLTIRFIAVVATVVVSVTLVSSGDAASASARELVAVAGTRIYDDNLNNFNCTSSLIIICDNNRYQTIMVLFSFYLIVSVEDFVINLFTFAI